MDRRTALKAIVGLAATPSVALAEFDIFGGPEPAAFDVFGDATSEITEAVITRDKSLPLINVYAPTWCSGCPAKVAELRKLKGFEFVVHTESANFPEWTQAVAGVYPIIEWRVGGKWYCIDDFTTATEFKKRFDLSKPQPVRVATAPSQPRPAAVSGYYPTRGGNWSHPGSSRAGLINHLQSGEHRGKFSRSYLELLSYSELESLHSDDHEGRVRWQYVGCRSASTPRRERRPGLLRSLFYSGPV